MASELILSEIPNKKRKLEINDDESSSEGEEIIRIPRQYKK